MMLRRHGGLFETIEANACWTGEWFNRIHSESYIRSLADAGFNCVTIHFHKGFGLAAEAEEMELTRRTIELCHRYGIRALTYVQSMSVMAETFFAEMPAARDWVQVDEAGRPRAYGEQDWRLLPCLSNRNYVEYVKTVAKTAIKWACADGVWLDNTNFMPCACEACQAGFQAFLRGRHPEVDAGRFGIADLSRSRISTVGQTYDPIHQESTRYRCAVVKKFVEEMRKFVRGLNSEAVVAANFGVPAPYNVADTLGVNDSQSLREVDISLAENGNFPTMSDGRMVTQILAHKQGRATGTVIVPSHWKLADANEVNLKLPDKAADVKLTLAESAAFGGRCVGATWACRPIEAGRRTLLERDDIRAAVKQYNAFFAKHEQLFVSAKCAGRVATYRNFASQAFTHDAFTRSVLGMEQALIHHHVPFKALFAEDLRDLAGTRHAQVLVLANVLCMSDEEIANVRAFVNAGGSLFATGLTSLYDQDRRQRRNYGLADVFGVSFAEVKEKEIYRTARTIFVPRTLEAAPYNHLNYQLRPELPAGHADLVGFVRELDADAAMFTLEGAEFVGTDIQHVPDGILLHLVNYDNTAPPARIRLTIADALRLPSTVVHLSPDIELGQESLAVTCASDGRRMIEIPKLDTYSLLLMKGGHP
jgi:hypothetical protein